MIKLFDKSNKTKIFLFHIQKKALHFFCRSVNNKSFLLYLICLELSNNKGFCHLNTKEMAEIFGVTPKSICNWINNIHNNKYITAHYNPYKHFWKIRINTKRHYELWQKFGDCFDGEEMSISQLDNSDENAIEIQILDSLSNDIHNNPQNNPSKINQLQESSEESYNQNQKRSNEMNEQEIEMELAESSKKLKAFMENFNLGVNKKKSERESNQKVLIVTPYKTFIDKDISNTANITYTLEMIEAFERMERERIINFVGQPLSPIKNAFKKARKIIKSKNITAQDKINEIIQNSLNNIRFLDEIDSVDSVSILVVNFNNLKEINEINDKAESLNKQTQIKFISCLNESETNYCLTQAKNGIDCEYFFMTPPSDDEILELAKEFLQDNLN